MSVTAAGILPRTERSPAWLYGRWTDLLIGCGLAYALSIPLLFVINKTTGVSQWPGAVAMALSLLVNTPHYGATLVRVYEAREQRRKYFFFTVYVTLAMLALFAASSRSVWLASAVLTAYVNWNPWHASGQNYGLTLLFLRRRGVAVDPVTKRLLYASFVLSAGSAILALNSGSTEFLFLPQTLPVANAAGYHTFAPPAALVVPLWAAVFFGYLGCLGTATWRLSRHARPGDLGPAFLLVFSQALWFSIPALLLAWGVKVEALLFSTIWISVAHSVQYLWVTAYYERSARAADSTMLFLLKSLVAGTAALSLPGLIMAPNLLGSVPWDVGLASTLFAAVNLHHFILDGAIWKLRDGRVAQFLLRGPGTPVQSPATSPPESRRWLRTLVWTVAAFSLLVPLTDIYGKVEIERATRPEEFQRVAQALKWVGRETTQVYYRIGMYYAREGRHDQAITQFRRSIELFPTGRVWLALGNEYRVLGQWGRARSAFESAIELNPDAATAHFGRAQALLKLSSGSREEAVASLERALEISPGYSRAAVLLALQYNAMGRKEEAIRTLERSLDAEKQSDEASVRRELDRLRS